MPAVADWYHCSVKPVSRSAGRSAVAAAAYRVGERLHDEMLGETYDYTRRSGIVTTFTLAPEHAPDWVYGTEALWNAAERAEKRINSQVAREYELALPANVSADEREGIARAFAQELVDRYGVAVTTAIHAPSRYGDDRNFHAHILSTTRVMGPDGLGKKTRILDDIKTGPQEVLYLRGYACDLINDALERAGVDERVDHRSFEARGIDKEATEHLGPGASEMEREGKASDKGDKNRDIVRRNEEHDRLVEELAALDAEIAAEEERQLNERFGEPEPDAPEASEDRSGHRSPDDKPESPDGSPEAAHEASDPPQASPQAEATAATGWWTRALTYARDAALTFWGFHERMNAWRYGERDVHFRPSPFEDDTPKSWWERAEEYAVGYLRDLHERGEISYRDGLTRWERAVNLLESVRKH